jgi:hypothetical protein
MCVEKVKKEQHTAPQMPASRMEWYASSATSFGEEAQKMQESIDAQNAEVEKVRKAKEDAVRNQRSIFASLVREQEPVYDNNKEDILRKRAIVKSLGDMLSAASSGYFAYRKGGQGRTPMALSDPMQEVNKISEMQEVYNEERKAWQDLNARMRQSEAEYAAVAADALLTKEEAKLAEMKKQQNDLFTRSKENYEDAVDSYYDAIEAEEKAAKDMETFKEKEQIKDGYIRGRNSHSAQEDEEEQEREDYLNAYEQIYGFGDKERDVYKDGIRQEGVTTKERKTINDLSETEKKAYENQARNNAVILAYRYLIEVEGIIPKDALELIMTVRNNEAFIAALEDDEWDDEKETLKEFIKKFKNE